MTNWLNWTSQIQMRFCLPRKEYRNQMYLQRIGVIISQRGIRE